MTPDELSDDELIVAMPRDAGAFDIFYRRHVQHVMRFFAGRLSDAEDVADATAATFVTVLDSCRTYRSELGTGQTWLFAIARNVVRRNARSLERRDRLVTRLQGRDLLTPDDAERIAEMIDAEHEAARLGPALKAARPSELELIERIASQDLTPAEASRSLGIAPGAGRLRLARLRANLRSFSHDDDRSAPTCAITPLLEEDS